MQTKEVRHGIEKLVALFGWITSVRKLKRTAKSNKI